MKLIHELTEKEILALTNDQLALMVKYKMAEDGIKILEYPAEPELQQLPNKDAIYYQIENFDFVTTNRELADKISLLMMKALPELKNLTYVSGDYSAKVVKEIEEYTKNSFGQTKQLLTYSAENSEIVVKIKKQNEALQSAYKTLLSEYKENEEQADYIRAEIYGRYKEVTDKYAQFERLKYIYQSYLELASGDKKIAMNFLKKAYTVDHDTELYVQGKEVPEPAKIETPE